MNKKEYLKQYRETHKEERKVYLKANHKKILEQNKIYRRKRYREFREEAKKLVGNKCIICGFENRICFHEIYGKDHTFNGDWQKSLRYIIKHHKDFVPLCRPCHTALHKLVREGSIKEFFRLVKILIKSQKPLNLY